MDETRQKAFLMCPPEHFGVDYVINPWMEAGLGRQVFAGAPGQWESLRLAITDVVGARVETLAAQPGLPDLVFTANAGLIVGDLFIPSRFRFPQRAREEAPFATWATARGFEVRPLPDGIHFEGAGDGLFDRRRSILWVGHGFRTDEAAIRALHAALARENIEVKPLRLVDPRFYHLDTCFCPLDGGHTMYFPAAFDEASQRLITATIPAEQRLEVGEEDAREFACNAVHVNGSVVMNRCGAGLRAQLEGRGLRVVETPLSEFIYSGGAAKCLTLRLDEPLTASWRA